MTENRNFKRRVRARAARTGESYTSALRHLRPSSNSQPQARSVRLAVAQTTACDDPRDIAGLRRAALEIRRLMLEARQLGARLVHFPEGATCTPNKRTMSSTGREHIGPSDWTRFEWAVLREELDAIGTCARELGLWTVLGSVHPLTEPNRPHNSLYVVSDRGQLVTRYDERMLSNTKVSFMYAPGSIPVTFDVDGVRFGCTLGMESHFPELFAEYERLDVDCVLFSTTGGALPDGFSAEMQGHAASNSYWTSFAVHAQHSATAPSGIIASGGRWAARCPADGSAAIAVADISCDAQNLSRPWRRTARSGIYEPHLVNGDPRSDDRDSF
ncbi:amidohydrolase [Aminobacter sp. DSM 101952]|uniref:carbon-nitrogen hydrolase family protein n=1 Tax=Aminobacter sp. DSM 101952 TaxID=2735891 RepID=UPI0006FBBA40|nr:carbon-nitrogen hydrolase family protein [Aminobacter sp. DSM 101952]KQU64362.1 amidohydrolase [Aminobacter sp. DSM 101952]